MLSISHAFLMSLAMGATILFCRAFPFLFFRDKRRNDGTPLSGLTPGSRFRSLVEKAAPPVTMTVLAVNAMSGPIREAPQAAFPVLTASLFTVLVHLWKRNSLLSIMGGTAVYMVLNRLAG
ncbi:MAG: AzlD domain-containing protein [Treponema sp.]|jgi:branched-subunit amino acid transport protein AzlD|nr:AzlD domain-containing protein [Treponema sp.]